MTQEGSWFNISFSSISSIIQAGVSKTKRTIRNAADGIMNYGKCYMCKETADCNIPCGHILCHRCLTFYIESQGIQQPEFVLCYICSNPIPLQNILIDYEPFPYEEEKIPIFDPKHLPNPKRWSFGQEESKFTILEETKIKKSQDLFDGKVFGSSSSSSEEDEELEEIKPLLVKEIRVKECPFCEWSLEIPTDSRYETCKNIECNRSFCPQCNQVPHLDRACSKKEKNERIVQAYESKCPVCLSEFIKTEGCNFLWCPNSCSKSCFCLICKTYIPRCEYFTHYTKTGPFGNTCNENKN